jgi:hypothetical protein
MTAGLGIASECPVVRGAEDAARTKADMDKSEDSPPPRCWVGVERGARGSARGADLTDLEVVVVVVVVVVVAAAAAAAARIGEGSATTRLPGEAPAPAAVAAPTSASSAWQSGADVPAARIRRICEPRREDASAEAGSANQVKLGSSSSTYAGWSIG